MIHISLLNSAQRLPFLKALLCNLAFIAQLRYTKASLIKPLHLPNKHIVLPDWYDTSNAPPPELQYIQMKAILEHIMTALDSGQQAAQKRLIRAAAENSLIQDMLELLTKITLQIYSPAPHGALSQIINLLNSYTPNISAAQLQQGTHRAFHAHSARAHKRMVAHRTTNAVLATQAAVEVIWYTLAGRQYQHCSLKEYEIRALAGSAFITHEIHRLSNALLAAGIHIIAPFSRHCYPKKIG